MCTSYEHFSVQQLLGKLIDSIFWYLHTKFHMPGRNGSLVIGIKHKGQEIFLHGYHVLHSTRNNAFKKAQTLFQCLKIKYCSVVLMSPIPCICHFIIFDHRQLKCLMGWPPMAWSLLSFLKIGLMVQNLVWGTAHALEHTHTHITSHCIDPIHLLFTVRKGP